MKQAAESLPERLRFQQNRNLLEEREMNNGIGAFLIWSVIGLFFVGMGIASFFAKKAMGFWANVRVPEIDRVKPYNHAVGRLYIIFGILMVLFGLPLLSGNTAFILFSVLGVMLAVITMMVIYSRIEQKYRK